MTVPARSPVDDALDRLDAALLRWAQSEWHEDYPAAVAALATVRSELERLREERDDARAMTRIANSRAAGLRRELDEAIHAHQTLDGAREDALSEEVRRLTEGLRELLDAFPMADPYGSLWEDYRKAQDKTRALLSASPDGGGAK